MAFKDTDRLTNKSLSWAVSSSQIKVPCQYPLSDCELGPSYHKREGTRRTFQKNHLAFLWLFIKARTGPVLLAVRVQATPSSHTQVIWQLAYLLWLSALSLVFIVWQHVPVSFLLSLSLSLSLFCSPLGTHMLPVRLKNFSAFYQSIRSGGRFEPGKLLRFGLIIRIGGIWRVELLI